MRQMLCDVCVKLPLYGSDPVHEGRYELLAASGVGEPAEWVRVARGVARQPTTGQRTMYVSEQPIALLPDAYDCDHCNAKIRPGDPAWCVTVWQPARQKEPPAWESEFLFDELPETGGSSSNRSDR